MTEQYEKVDEKTHEKILPVVSASGRFSHPWPIRFVTLDIIKWLITHRRAPAPSMKAIQEMLPTSYDYRNFVENSQIDAPATFKDIAIWMGHSSVMVSMDGKTLVFDPVFSNRVPEPLGPHRFKPSVTVDNSLLPKTVDFGFISHNHYDHLDAPSVNALCSHYPSMQWFCGMCVGLARISYNAKSTEMTWFDEHDLGEGLRIVFLPAQHWSMRLGFDFRKSLWGSWAVIGRKHRFFFAGDTGYNDTIFKRIGEMYGPFDLSAIPIGAYHPRNALGNQHVCPAEAVKIHQDIRSKKSFAIHWGTFSLGDEPFDDPPKKLAEALMAANLSPEDFRVIKHGESIEF